MGRKASFIPTPDKVAKPIYLTVNADESEPGTFKDREIMLRVPHRLIEGCLIAAHAIQSKHVFIYIRGEYLAEYEIARRPRSTQARGAGILGDVDDRRSTAAPARTSAARRPPCSSRSRASAASRARSRRSRRSPGLYASPTLINNVETITTVPKVLEIGAGGVREDRRAARLDRHARLLPLRQRRSGPARTSCRTGSPVRHLIDEHRRRRPRRPRRSRP